MDMECRHEVFNQDTFAPAFIEDLRTARAAVIIQSPFVTLNRIYKLRTYLLDCVERGVRVCAFVQRVDEFFDSEHSDARREALRASVQILRSWGIHVSARDRIHEKLAVIDESVLWEGSLNILSHSNTFERMNRWEGRSKVREVVVSHKLNQCDGCNTTESHLERGDESEATRRKSLGQFIVDRRIQLQMSQHELATAAGVQPGVLSGLERGTRDVRLSTLMKLCPVLAVEVRAIPKLMLGAVDKLSRE